MGTIIVTHVDAVSKKTLNKIQAKKPEWRIGTETFADNAKRATRASRCKVRCVRITYDNRCCNFGWEDINYYNNRWSSASFVHIYDLCELLNIDLETDNVVAVELNDEYSAKIDLDENTIEVGCQTFDLSVLDNIKAAIENVKNKQKAN